MEDTEPKDSEAEAEEEESEQDSEAETEDEESELEGMLEGEADEDGDTDGDAAELQKVMHDSPSTLVKLFVCFGHVWMNGLSERSKR